MAIKPPTKPADGDEVAISFFTDMYDENETYLNKAIKSDTDFVTGKTEQNAESGWTPVRNMGATFTVEESSTPSTILCSFYAYEMGGALSAWGEGQVDNFGNNPGRLEETWCAEFALFVNGERVTATERYLYASTSWQHMHARKQFSFIATPTFSAGVNHVVVMCLVRSLAASPKPDASSATPRQVRFLDGYARSDVKPTFNAPGWKHIMVGGRSMVIDIHAL